MSKREDYERRTEELAAEHIRSLGLILYDVEYVKEGADNYLRIYIDKEGGVDISDCERLSGIMNPILDREDYIEDAYIFEVSSPGLGRSLKKDRHLQYSLGEEVEIKLYTAVNKQKQFSGILKAFDKDSITIASEETETVFARKDIANIRLALDF